MIRPLFPIALAASLTLSPHAARAAAPETAPAATPPPAAATRTLTGSVVDAIGKPLAGARVFVARAWPKVGESRICPSCYPDCAKDAEVDAQGAFRIADLDATLQFELIVAAPGYTPSTQHVRNPGAKPVRLMLKPVKGGETPDKRATGRILDPQGRPVAGATVSIHGVTTGDSTRYGDNTGVEPLAITDADGRFAFHGTEPFDALKVEVRARGYADGGCTLVAGDTVTEHRVQRGAIVTGRLVRDGRPVPGARIGLVREPDHGHRVAAVTDADGRFSLYEAQPDTGYHLYVVPGSTGGRGVLVPVKIKAPGTDTTLPLGDVALAPGLTVAGRLRLTDGKPAPAGLGLSLSHRNAWVSADATTAADGSFRFTDIAPGEVTLHTRIDGYRPAVTNSLECNAAIGGELTADKTDLILEFEPGDRLNYREMEKRQADRPLSGAERVLPAYLPYPPAADLAAARAERRRQEAESLAAQRDAKPWRLAVPVVEQADNAQPVAGARVRIRNILKINDALHRWEPVADDPATGRVLTAGADGRVDFGEFAPDRLAMLEITAPGHRQGRMYMTYRGPGEEPPTVELARLAEHAEPPLRLLITDEQGAPVPDATAIVRSRSMKGETHYRDNNVEDVTAGESAGIVHIWPHLPYDSATVDIRAAGFAPATVRGLKPGASAHPVRLERGGRIIGRLVKDGQPLAGIAIRAEEIAKRSDTYFDSVSATTDAAGRFTLDHLPPDHEYAVYAPLDALAARGVTATRTVKSPAHGATTDLGDLVATAGVRLAGRVFLNDGKFATDLRVHLRRNDELWDRLTVNCSDTGEFVIPHAPRDIIAVGAYAPKYRLSANNAGLNRRRSDEIMGRLDAEKLDLVLELEPDDGDRNAPSRAAPLHGAESP